MLERVKDRLQSFGYKTKVGDEAIIQFEIQKVENYIKNDCNLNSIPDGLIEIAVDMVVGEFLKVKKTFKPDSITGIDLDAVVKQIQVGDTNTSFAVGEGNLTPEQRLDTMLDYLTNNGKEQLACYRKIRW